MNQRESGWILRFASIPNVIFYEKKNIVSFEDNACEQSDMAFPVSVDTRARSKRGGTR